MARAAVPGRLTWQPATVAATRADPRPALLIGGGSGVAPLMSMARATCPFAAAFVSAHLEYADVLDPAFPRSHPTERGH